MAQFASASDLAERLGVTISGAEQTRADALLATASGLIQAEARQAIELVADDVLELRGTSDDRVRLPERPVVSVGSVTLDGVALAEGTDWYLDGSALVRMPSTILGLTAGPLCRGFGNPSQELVVTYTHGFAPGDIPGAVKAVCLEAVVRVWVNPGAVVGERHGSEQVQYMNGTPTGILLTGVEERTIRRLFGRRAGSVPQS